MVACDADGQRTKIKIERRDLAKMIGVVIGVVGAIMALLTTVAVPLMTNHFQSRQQAILEHAAIEQKQALHELKIQMQQQMNDKRIGDAELDRKEIKALGITTADNVQVLMREIGLERWKIKSSPKGIRTDDLDFGAVE